MVGKTREEKKASAFLRAQLSVRQAFERIDYAEDVIKPQLLEMRANALKQPKVAGELENPDGA